MRIVVTGGTGFIGLRLIRRLMQEGHEVRVLARDGCRAARRLPAGCSVHDWLPPARIDAVLGGSDAIVHLAGENVAGGRWSADRKRAILSSRVSTTDAVLRALQRLPARTRPRVLVSASAVGIYGDRGDEALDERSVPGAGFLADVCRQWEESVSAARALGVRTASLRIGLVLGRESGVLARLAPLFRLGLGGRLGSGRHWMSWIHVDDVVELLKFAVERDDVDGPLDAVAPEPVRNIAFTRELARACGRLALLPVPRTALRLAAGEMAAMLVASQRVHPRAALAAGFRFRYPTLHEALHDLCADWTEQVEREVWLPLPPSRLFSFFADPRNLERITPPFLRFRVLGASTEEVGDGTLIDYRLRLHGLPLRWQSCIEQWRPTARFVDRQVRGPFSLWHHTHELEPSRGGTIVRDRVRYRLPLGALGSFAAGTVVRRDVERIFDFRHDAIRAIFDVPLEEGRQAS